jgi:hypothetical protein
MYQIKRQGDDRQKLEQDIYRAGCKLRTIMEENLKLENVRTQSEKNVSSHHDMYLNKGRQLSLRRINS